MRTFWETKIRRVYELLFFSCFLREGQQQQQIQKKKKKINNTKKKKQGKATIVHSFRIAQQGCPLYIQCFPMCHLAVLDGCLERDNEVYLEADYTSFVAPRCSIL